MQSCILAVVVCAFSRASSAPESRGFPDPGHVSCSFARIDVHEDDASERFVALRDMSPIVLTNFIDDWAAFHTWHRDVLRARVGQMQLTSGDVHPGVLDGGWEEGISLSVALDAFSSKPRLLLLRPQSEIVQLLGGDLRVPPILKDVQRFGPQLSIGGRGQAAVFNHHQQNWLAQVFGRKLWMLYAPSLLGDPPYAENAHPCQYLELESELEEAQRRLKICVVHPGEIIYLPEGWPHSTCNLDEYTVGVGYFGAIEYMSVPERAALLGHWIELESLLTDGVTGGSGNLLQLAAEAGHATVVQGLLDRGAEPSQVDAKGRSALHSAAKSGWPQVVSILLKARADLDAKDKDGKIPLIEASFAGNLAVVRALCGCSSMSSEHELVGESDCPGVACVNASWKCGSAPLRSAAAGGHVGVAQFLLQHGHVVDHVNVNGDDGEGAIERAAKAGHVALIELLLEHRADVNFRSRSGRSAIMQAAMRGHQAAIQTLLQHGANVSQRTSSGKTALLLAARRRNRAVVQLLLEGRAAPDAADDELRTGLHIAASAGHPGIVDVLLAAHASASVTDKQGRTVVDEAVRMGHVGVLRKLLTGALEPVESQELAIRALVFLDAKAHENISTMFSSDVRHLLELVRGEVGEL